MSELALQKQPDTAADRPVLGALRALEGRATVADVAAATGLAMSDAEASLRRLLETRYGHLEVAESGTLLYSFDPDLVRRDHMSLWTRLGESAWSAFKVAFKIWTFAMLVIYLVVFVALLVAAALKDEGGGGDWGGGGHGRRHHHGHFPSFWFWYLIWSPEWGWGRPYYGERWERRLGKKARVPVYKKVFAFVFGPDRPKPTQAQKDRSLLRLIRANRGVVTAADMVRHTGLSRADADSELARLMAAHEGDVRVSEDGELVYVFESLMMSAHGTVDARLPDPAWRRLEAPLPVTGNSTGTNVAIGLVNGFNLVAAATAPLFIFPRLGLGGPVAWTGLVWVPLAFSTTFFAIPLARRWGVTRENVRRAGRNLRRTLLQPVFDVTMRSGEAGALLLSDAVARVRAMLSGRPVTEPAVDEQLQRITAEYDGDVEPAGEADFAYRFPALRHEVEAGAALRSELRLERGEIGDIVYSTRDDEAAAGRRELEAFDRELERLAPGGAASTAPGVAYVEDFDLVAFDEELARRGG